MIEDMIDELLDLLDGDVSARDCDLAEWLRGYGGEVLNYLMDIRDGDV